MTPSALPSYQISVDDPALRRYLQQYPFASGPDRGMNDAAFRAAVRSVRRRDEAAATAVDMADRAALRLADAELARAFEMLARLGCSAAEQAAIVEDYAWRLCRLPRDACRVLSIGCGSGIELVFLRAVLPDAEITAVEYADTLRPGLAALVQPRFIAGDLNAELDRLPRGTFDLVFSNHTLEHLYDPDRTVDQLAAAMAPRAVLASGLPLDAVAVAAFGRETARLLQNPAAIHPVDSILLDYGHPWKTDADGLAGLLARHGFGDVRIFQRAYHLGRMAPGDRRRYGRLGRAGVALNRATFGVARSLVKAAYPKAVPPRLVKALYAIDNRTWFGTNRLKNWLAPDVVFVAVRQAD